MPPHQTSPALEPGRDEFAVTYLQPQRRNLLRHKAIFAVIRSIAAAPAFLFRCWRVVLDRRRQQRSRALLYQLSDHQLHDIGVRRDEIQYLTSQPPISDATRILWITSRGVP